MGELEGCTVREVEGRLGARTIAILPLGSTEPHGPHLPLDTDAVLARAIARGTATELGEDGVDALVLPTLPYGITRLTQDFEGGVTLRPGSLWALVEDVLLSLQQDGVERLLLVNAHQEHEQRRLLTNLTQDYPVRGEGRCQIMLPSSPAAHLEEGECHGGRRETSLMLAIAPELVRRELVAELPRVELELPEPARGPERSLSRLGATSAYLGDPAGASAEEGQRILAQLVAEHAAACRSTWPELFEATD